MSRIKSLISKLESAGEPCRLLDSEATGWALAPAGWVIDPIEDLDGWDIQAAPDSTGQAALWMCAADVGYVTRYMDAAMELLTQSRPDEAAAIAARAMVTLLAHPRPFANSGEFTQRAACQMVAELLRTIYADEASAEGSRLAA